MVVTVKVVATIYFCHDSFSTQGTGKPTTIEDLDKDHKCKK